MRSSSSKSVLVLSLLALCLVATPLVPAAEDILSPALGDTSDSFAGGQFGITIPGGPGFGLSGDVLVGGTRDDLPGEGNQGSATVFHHDGSAWVEGQTLVSSTGDTNDYFGYSAAVCGDVIVIGAPYDDVSYVEQGSATVFRWNGTTWVEEQLLVASGGQKWDTWGTSVAINGDVIAVANYYDDVGGNIDQGSVTVFRWNGTTWIEEQLLLASGGQQWDTFGTSVSVSGDVIAVGAYLDEVGGLSQAGSVTMFRWNGSLWVEEQTLSPTGAEIGASFGASVALHGDVVVGGAPFATAGGDIGAGNATVFRWDGATWVEGQTLEMTGGEEFDYFGSSVAVNGHTIAVGALYDDIAGDSNRGSVTLERWNGTSWVEQFTFSSIVGAVNDSFGVGVAVDGDTIAAAAPGHDVGGNGNQGAISVFELPVAPWTDQGSALAGVFGDPLLVGQGDLSTGSDNLVSLSQAAPSALAGIFIGLAGGGVPFKGGTLKPFPFVGPVILGTGPTGTLPLPFVMPPGVPPGTEMWVQWAIQDATAIKGASLSNAILGLTP
jgi:hypothetical protein